MKYFIDLTRFIPLVRILATMLIATVQREEDSFYPASLHPGELGSVAEVSEVHAASTFRVEVIEVSGFINANGRFGA
jgi:hypothetical protein